MVYVLIDMLQICLYLVDCSLSAGDRWNAVDLPEETKSEARAQREGARVIIDGKVCKTPDEAGTNLLKFLTTSDWHKRKLNYDIPFFTSGSYIAVTRADPHSPTGETRFVGICIAKRDRGLGSNFVLRNCINGMGVEITYETFSPTIRKIEVLKLEKRKYDDLSFLRDRPAAESTVDENMKPLNSKKIIFNTKKDKKYERELRKKQPPKRFLVTDYL